MNLKQMAIAFTFLMSHTAYSQFAPRPALWDCFEVEDLSSSFQDHREIADQPQARQASPPALSTEAYNEIARQIRNQEFHRYIRRIVEPSTVTSFLTWNWNLTDYRKKNYVLDADIQTPIALGGRGWGLNTVHIIPRFKVRIFNDDDGMPLYKDESLAVRTPSYMPGIAYYHSFKEVWGDQKAKKGIPDMYAGFYAFHHSNGQDGPEFFTQDPNKVNVYNGNFGEQIVFELIHGGRIRKTIKFRNDTSSYLQSVTDKLNKKEREIAQTEDHNGKTLTVRTGRARELSWRVGYEEHFKKLTNQEFLAHNLYGRHRVNLNLILTYFHTDWDLVGNGEKWCTVVPDSEYERWRLALTASYIVDGQYNRGSLDALESVGFFNAGQRLNMYFTAYRVLGSSEFTALFIRAGYMGSDSYNIYFNQSIWEVKAGLAFGFFDQPDTRVRN